MRKAVSTLGVAALALTLGACGGGSDEKAAEKAAEKILEGVGGEDVDIDIDEDGGSVSIGGEDGGSIDVDTDGEDSGSITFGDGEGGESTINYGGDEIPEDLSHIDLPDDYRVLSAVSSSDSGGMGAMATVAANGDVNEVADAIKAGLESDGYTVTDALSGSSGGVASVVLSYEGNGVTGTLSVADDTSTEGFNIVIAMTEGSDTGM